MSSPGRKVLETSMHPCGSQKSDVLEGPLLHVMMMGHKADVPNLVTSPNRTPRKFERFVDRCMTPRTNSQKTYICLKETGLCVQNMITILSSRINITEGD